MKKEFIAHDIIFFTCLHSRQCLLVGSNFVKSKMFFDLIEQTVNWRQITTTKPHVSHFNLKLNVHWGVMRNIKLISCHFWLKRCKWHMQIAKVLTQYEFEFYQLSSGRNLGISNEPKSYLNINSGIVMYSMNKPFNSYFWPISCAITDFYYVNNWKRWAVNGFFICFILMLSFS